MALKNFKSKRIFITGGGGFIGSHLSNFCLRLGGKVGVLVNCDHTKSSIYSLKNKIKIFQSSITDEKKIKKIVKQFNPQLVFHLAAVLDRRQSFDLIDKLYDTHVNGTKHLISALLKNPRLERFIYVGTIEEYGKGSAPFDEQQRELPISPYSLTKTMAVKLVEYAVHQEGFKAVIVRPALTYGPGQRMGMLIPNIINACLSRKNFDMTAGKQTRDFLFIDDLIEGLIATAQAKNINGEIINLGSGKEISVKTVAKMINRMMGNPIKINFGAMPYKTGENMHFWLHTQKAKKMLGWVPKVNLKKGLEITISQYI